MSIPTPDQSPEGPRYQGRLLPNPDDEVVDQGLQFDVVTLMSRRRALGFLGIGAGAFALAACGAASSDGTTSSSATTGTDLLEIPDETNGPYPADGTNGPDILEQSGVVRSDITSSFGDSTTVAEGVPLTFTFTIIDMANGNVPWEGAAVYAWQCDAEGKYSMYSEGLENENYLRGVQVADADGNVTFTSIFPACYSGRWPHIHFEVYPDVDSITDHDNCVSTSQTAFPEDACQDVYDNVAIYSASIQTFSQVSIETDGIFDPETIDQQMITLSGDRESGFTGTLTVPVDTTTEQTGGDMGDGGGGGGGEVPSGEPGEGGGPGGDGEPPSGEMPSGEPPSDMSSQESSSDG